MTLDNVLGWMMFAFIAFAFIILMTSIISDAIRNFKEKRKRKRAGEA